MKVRLVALCSAVCLWGAASVRAQHTWAGESATEDLLEAENWAGENAPEPHAGAFSATFAALSSELTAQTILVPDFSLEGLTWPITVNQLTFGANRPEYTFQVHPSSNEAAPDFIFAGEVTVSSGRPVTFSSGLEVQLSEGTNRITVHDGATLNVYARLSEQAQAAAHNVSLQSGPGTVWIAADNSSLVKAGSGTLRIGNSGSNFAGGMTIEEGLVIATASQAFGSGAVSVESGGTLSISGTTIPNAVSLQSGSRISGQGGYSTVVIGSGVTLAPGAGTGAGVGHLNFEHLTFEPGGTFDLSLSALPNAGTAGQHWDFVSVSLPGEIGQLHLDLTPTEKFTFRLNTVTTGGTSLTLTGFQPGEAYRWAVLSAESISADTADLSSLFAINVDNFDVDVSLEGADFWISRGSGLEANTLFLNFRPVPEPSTYALMAFGLGAIGYGAWRRRFKRLKD